MSGDQSLPGMDVDAIERHLAEAMGDHSDWSHEQLRKLMVEDFLLSPSDLIRFGDYALGNMRPDGGQSSFPLLTREEFQLTEKPYHEWALAPHNSLSYSCMHKLGPMMYGLCTPDINPRVTLPARLKPLRTKMWKGMVPITRDRWLERKMDDPKNYRNLFELMDDILLIFAWLNDTEVHAQMRRSFNHQVDCYVEFGAAINNRREQSGVSERLDFAGMWAEYLKAIVSTSANRTYTWVADRVEEVTSRAFTEYNQALEQANGDQVKIGHAGKAYYECVQDLRGMLSRMSYTIGLSLEGFRGYVSNGETSDLSFAARSEIYGDIGDTLDWQYLSKIEAEKTKDPVPQMDILALVDQMKNGPKPAPAHFSDTEAFIGHYHEGKRNLKELVDVCRGERTPLGQQDWITILKERMEFYLANGRDRATHRWGFVCYRLTYDQTDEQWAEFKTKLEADVFRSGDWIQGYDSIKDMAGYDYIDGRTVGIAEGDIEAAKKHFAKTYTMLPTLGRMWKNDFVVIDSHSYNSYMDPKEPDERPPLPYGPCFGDQGGWVRLVDTMETNPAMIKQQAPGYKGSLRVLSTLLLEDVYPLLATNSLRPMHLWNVARLHPKQVYVGHAVEAQEAWWESQRIDKVSMTSGFFQFLRMKQAGMGGAGGMGGGERS